MQLTKIDLEGNCNYRPFNDIDLGFWINHELKLFNASKVTDQQNHLFKKEAVSFLSSLCTDAKETSPLQSQFAWNLNCLSSITLLNALSAKRMF